MKRMKQAATFAMVATLATVTILSVSPAIATDNVQSATIHASKSSVITPMATRSPLTSTLGGTNWVNSFYIDPGYGWVKLWVQNTSSTETMNVRVTQGSLTGAQKMSFSVAPNSQVIQYAASPWAVGEHWVSITSASGGQMSGNMSVKIGNTLAELQQ